MRTMAPRALVSHHFGTIRAPPGRGRCIPPRPVRTGKTRRGRPDRSGRPRLDHPGKNPDARISCTGSCPRNATGSTSPRTTRRRRSRRRFARRCWGRCSGRCRSRWPRRSAGKGTCPAPPARCLGRPAPSWSQKPSTARSSSRSLSFFMGVSGGWGTPRGTAQSRRDKRHGPRFRIGKGRGRPDASSGRPRFASPRFRLSGRGSCRRSGTGSTCRRTTRSRR
jgi:hypothetical protein